MQSPPQPDALRDDALHGTPFTTPLLSAGSNEQPVSPTATTGEDGQPAVDPLVARCAERIAAAINDFKRELDERDSVWGSASGTLDLSMNTDGSQTYELTVVHDEDGAEYPVTVRATEKKSKESVNGTRSALAPLSTAAIPSTAYKRTRHDSDAELEKDFVSRKRRKRDDDDGSQKRARTDEGDDEDAMPLITKEDLQDLLSKLREDIQDDTTECVNHVQRLLRRFKEEWHERTVWEDEQASTRPARGPFRDSIVGNGSAFPSANVDGDDQNTSTNDLIRQEAKLLSNQIRWVEECRRVSSAIHEKRETNWRTTSAGFHDNQRQDRENFQNRMLHESSMQGKILNDILNEVKSIGLYTQSMKWETPSHLSTHAPYTPQMVTPTFPTQQPPPGTGRGRGGGRGGPNKR
jgi:hypothetical protein